MSVEQDIPAQTWLQEGPVGGAVAGQLPELARAVVVTGVVNTRVVPPLQAVVQTVPQVVAGTTVHLLGASPQRRRALISCTVDIILAPDKGQAQAGAGLLIKANLAPVEILACEEMYAFVAAAGPGNIHVWAEVDPG